MIRDVIIIKDGIPLISKNFTDSGEQMFSGTNDLIMVSGFFSALNSFSDQFNNLGSINELRLSKNEYKLAFIKDKTVPNLIYLASFDETSKGINVQRYLRKISQSFLKKYNAQQLQKWSGRVDAFKQFESTIYQYVEQEKQESEAQFKEKVEDLFENVQKHLDEDEESDRDKQDKSKDKELKPRVQKREEKEAPQTTAKTKNSPHSMRIPKLKVPDDLNPKFYLTGETSIRIFHAIDGKKSILNLAQELNVPEIEIFNLCKNMVKLGLIDF